jgi:hypothetical protein
MSETPSSAPADDPFERLVAEIIRRRTTVCRSASAWPGPCQQRLRNRKEKSDRRAEFLGRRAETPEGRSHPRHHVA